MSTIIVNGFLNFEINNLDHSSTLSPNFVTFFGVEQFDCPPFQNGTPEIHPKINSYEIGWFDQFFLISFNEQMNITEINIFTHMFDNWFGIDRLVVVYWVEKTQITGIPTNINDISYCIDRGGITSWRLCKTKFFWLWRSWLNTDTGKKKIMIYLNSARCVFENIFPIIFIDVNFVNSFVAIENVKTRVFNDTDAEN